MFGQLCRHISSNSSKKINIGKNNYIEAGVEFVGSVTLGNNNRICAGTVIYPNTVIGNNNTIFPGNILGEHPLLVDRDMPKISEHHNIYRGLRIGDNNYFKENNRIFSGCNSPTLIGNNNFLSNVLIGHDVTINNNVNLHDESVVGRYCYLFDYSGIGPRGFLVQNKKLGSYGFVGMNTTCSRDVFPIFFDGGDVYELHGHKFMRSL